MKLPSKEYVPFKRALHKFLRAQAAKELEQSRRIYTKLMEQLKGRSISAYEFRQALSDAVWPPQRIAGGGIRTDFSKSCDVNKYRIAEVLGREWGHTKRTRPIRPLKRHFSVPKQKDMRVRADEAYIMFNDAHKTVLREVPGNNHACEIARNSPEGQEFFKLLAILYNLFTRTSLFECITSLFHGIEILKCIEVKHDSVTILHVEVEIFI